ncbi:unnamed protein product [Urochloa humidicola]
MDLRKVKLLFRLMLVVTVILLASHGASSIVGAGADDSCGNSPYLTCATRCFQSGRCNECCKERGFVRGKCVALGCYCCGSEE